MTNTNEKLCVISGASTGIGRACAFRLAGAGWHVLAGVRKAADAGSIEAEARGAGLSGSVKPLMLDVTSGESIAAAAEEVRIAVQARSLPGLAGLVNNAGIAVVGPAESVSLAQWRHQFEVNFFGQVALTQALLPLLRPCRGRIVLMSSIAGRLSQPFMSPYCASKHALEALGDALRLELRAQGVGVFIVEPGAIKTPIWSRGQEAAERIEQGMSPEARGLYGAALEGVRAAAKKAEEGGIGTEAVCRVVEQMLTARRPPLRRLVGRDAAIGAALVKWLPRRLMDVLVHRAFGLHQSGHRGGA